VQHAAVIHHQQVAAAQKPWQFSKLPVGKASAVEFQQATCGTLRQRGLGDQFGRQEVIEIRQCQRGSIQFAVSTSP
jgi:hypothetical protein